MRSSRKLACVILAAGLGTRMKSRIPKVLHKLYDMPLLGYSLLTAARLRPLKVITVVGKDQDLIRDSVKWDGPVRFALQKTPKGTAHALMAAVPLLKGFTGTTIVMNSDTPLVTAGTLKKFIGLHRRRGNHLSVLSFVAGDPSSYGRIIRDRRGRPLRVVEDRDATAEEKAVGEVNSGVYAIEAGALPLLSKIKLNRKKGEYYLTDLLEVAVKSGMAAGVFCVGQEEEFLGINTRRDLQKAHEVLKRRQTAYWLQRGVNFIEPESVFIGPSVQIGSETLIYPNVFLEGTTKVGRGCTIYPNVRVVDSSILDGATLKDSSLVEGSAVGRGAQVGPFAHLRPGSKIGAAAKIGNFVEVKKSAIGRESKAMHLTYIGDSEVGRRVNIGAGTITCNYDGRKKHRTVIGNGVFVGSDSQLVAPVRIGRGSYIGAGSTITEDVPADALAISRARQRNIKGWKKSRTP
jgi:bifunctional UDP-N-acetylglucosamine pyrophosphorylase/glucosamine-1-phosphate N-acetyltransferase